ncbi:DUF952 domain-containing protein [Paeniglutamicibacter gangotriensis]|uniref:DUF952 domain-containing protein n=1 Tax=Paeniglutamicibacter gangotriensis TaxID=254787 RepID=A0A5B0E9M1_9MICC|nr:DUF952 domain-containing protein [Paeniglutamicibacter gangotriensis]KAA0974420.1 DUF952 domain-containing protein [Paeniglutamicibacter gangotriensis]
MTKILHLTETESWEAAQEAGVYRQSTRGATLAEVGYIHYSSEGQLPVVASFIYSDYSGELVVLELDASEIAAAGIEIRFEDGGTGELFPHLCGELQTEWVRATHRGTMSDGTLSVPDLNNSKGTTP